MHNKYILDKSHELKNIVNQHLIKLRHLGVKFNLLQPFGIAILNINLRNYNFIPKSLINILENIMSYEGFIVFKNQGILTGDQQVNASKLWGANEIHSTHSVHPKAPNKHIFRLSNNTNEGILGVGPQWHNDGSFLRDVFSHVGYHIIKKQIGGGTEFCLLNYPYLLLSDSEKERWSRLISVNCNSGVLHPLIHLHPISGQKCLWLHLGMTGAILEYNKNHKNFRLLNHTELVNIMNRYNNLLNFGFKSNYKYSQQFLYEKGDIVFIDNFSLSHRAMTKSHEPFHKNNDLRILHRTTIKSKYNFDPPYNLPYYFDINKKPTNNGVWKMDGSGFIWSDNIRIQN